MSNYAKCSAVFFRFDVSAAATTDGRRRRAARWLDDFETVVPTNRVGQRVAFMDSESVKAHLEKCAAQLCEWEQLRDFCLQVATDYQHDIDDLKRWVNSITSINIQTDHAMYQGASEKRKENRKRKTA